MGKIKLNEAEVFVVVAFKVATKQTYSVKPVEQHNYRTYRLNAKNLDTSKIFMDKKEDFCEIWCEIEVKSADGKITMVSDPIDKRTVVVKKYAKAEALQRVKNEVASMKIPQIFSSPSEPEVKCYIGYSTTANEEFVRKFERVKPVPNLSLENVQLQRGGLYNTQESRFEIFSRHECTVQGNLTDYTLHSRDIEHKTYFVGYELPESNSMIALKTADGQKVMFIEGSAAFTSPDNIDKNGNIIDTSKVGPKIEDAYGL